MKALKNHTLPYNTLSGCLEAYFGDRHTAKSSRVTTLARNATHSGNLWKYREPEQGFKTIPFQSLPLQLDYMPRRKNRPLIRLFTGH